MSRTRSAERDYAATIMLDLVQPVGSGGGRVRYRNIKVTFCTLDHVDISSKKSGHECKYVIE